MLRAMHRLSKGGGRRKEVRYGRYVRLNSAYVIELSVPLSLDVVLDLFRLDALDKCCGWLHSRNASDLTPPALD